MLSLFWDSQGIILMDVLPPNESITAQYYCDLLEKLNVAVFEKRRRRMSHGNLYLQHDNARPHTATITQEKITQLRLNILEHPPYSPDLAPTDFCLFRPMKSAFQGKDYASSSTVILDIQQWADSKPQQFFQDGINKLPGRWQRCIEHDGEYFENLCDVDD